MPFSQFPHKPADVAIPVPGKSTVTRAELTCADWIAGLTTAEREAIAEVKLPETVELV